MINKKEYWGDEGTELEFAEVEADGQNDLDIVYYLGDGIDISIFHNIIAIYGFENIDVSKKDTNFFIRMVKYLLNVLVISMFMMLKQRKL